MFSIKRIIDPAFKSPQLSQFDQITGAEVTGPAQVTLHTKSPYPVLLAQLVKLSIVPQGLCAEARRHRRSTSSRSAAGPTSCASWQRGVQIVLDANAGLLARQAALPDA